MSALQSWRDLDAQPMTPADARERASAFRSQANACPSASLGEYDWRARAADTFERTARRLEWQMSTKREGRAECA